MSLSFWALSFFVFCDYAVSELTPVVTDIFGDLFTTFFSPLNLSLDSICRCSSWTAIKQRKKEDETKILLLCVLLRLLPLHMFLPVPSASRHSSILPWYTTSRPFNALVRDEH